MILIDGGFTAAVKLEEKFHERLVVCPRFSGPAGQKRTQEN